MKKYFVRSINGNTADKTGEVILSVQDHNSLGGLNSGDYLHVTSAEKSLWNGIPATIIPKMDWIMGMVTRAGITHTWGADDYKYIANFTNANPITLTIPTDAAVAIPIGVSIKYIQTGDGVVTIAGSGGVTLVSNVPFYGVKGETRTVTKTAANTWILDGTPNGLSTAFKDGEGVVQYSDIDDKKEGYHEISTKTYYPDIKPLKGYTMTEVYDTTNSLPAIPVPYISGYKVQPKNGYNVHNSAGGSGQNAFIYMGLPYVLEGDFSFMVGISGSLGATTHYATIKVNGKCTNGYFLNTKVEILGEAGSVDYNITLGYSNKFNQHFIGFDDNTVVGYAYNGVRIYDFVVPVSSGNSPVKIYNDLRFLMFSESYGKASLRIDETIQVTSGQIQVGTSQIIKTSWHDKTIFFNTSCTITVPSTLPAGFIFNGLTKVGVTVTWAITAPKVWVFGAPNPTLEKMIFTFTQEGETNNVYLLGV